MDSNFFRSNFHDVCIQKPSDQIFNEKPPDHLSPPEPNATLIIHHNHGDVMKLILFVSIVICVVVNLLPYEYRDGSINPVPTVVFGNLSTTTFHAFIISIIFTFTGAFSSMLIRSSSSRRRVQFSYYEKFCRCYSLVFAAMAMAILVTALNRSVCQEMQIQIMDA